MRFVAGIVVYVLSTSCVFVILLFLRLYCVTCSLFRLQRAAAVLVVLLLLVPSCSRSTKIIVPLSCFWAMLFLVLLILRAAVLTSCLNFFSSLHSIHQSDCVRKRCNAKPSARTETSHTNVVEAPKNDLHSHVSGCVQRERDSCICRTKRDTDEKGSLSSATGSRSANRHHAPASDGSRDAREVLHKANASHRCCAYEGHWLLWRNWPEPELVSLTKH